MECADDFRAQAQIERELLIDFPVILREKCEVVGAVFMVIDAAAAEAEIDLARQDLLKICKSANPSDTAIAGVHIGGNARGIHKEKLPVKHLRKQFVEIDACVLTSEAKGMFAL